MKSGPRGTIESNIKQYENPPLPEPAPIPCIALEERPGTPLAIFEIRRRELSHFDTGEAGMQAISPIAASTAARIRPARDLAGSTETIAPSAARAVVPIRPVAAAAPAIATRRYPHAGFLAHLIAVKQRAPQTRRRGRATAGEASAAYTATQAAAAVLHFRKSA
jgi:hypothetical protein